MFLYPLGIMLVLIGALITWHATHDGISGAHIRSTLIIAYLSASLTCMELMRRRQRSVLHRDVTRLHPGCGEPGICFDHPGARLVTEFRDK